MKYFTADTHFGHHNVIGYCNRPFANSVEMNQVMLANLQRGLTEADDLYFLGDWSMDHKYYTLIKSVPFRHLYFILGNHDKAGKLTKQLEADDLVKRATVTKSLKIEIESRELFLVHRPMEASDEMPTLCGHVHEKWLRQEPGAVLQEYRNHRESDPRTIIQPILNVGVDQHQFHPISEQRVMALLDFGTGATGV